MVEEAWHHGVGCNRKLVLPSHQHLSVQQSFCSAKDSSPELGELFRSFSPLRVLLDLLLWWYRELIYSTSELVLGLLGGGSSWQSALLSLHGRSLEDGGDST